jgi:pilus assembly protein CpaB
VHTKSAIILILALVMGGIAAFLTRNWLESHSRALATSDSIGTIAVAAEPLAFGAELSADRISEIPWVANALPEGAFVAKDDLLKDGRRVVLSAVGRGEPILRSKITGPGQRAVLSSLLDVGKRAVTLRVDDVRGVAGFILPGDFVDVVLIAEDTPPRRESYSEILLQHVKVLGVDQLASERQEQPTVAKAVTVEVTTEQAQKVLLAANIGKLSLILRRPEEGNSDPNRRVTERDLGRTEVRSDVTRQVGGPPPPVVPAPAPAAAPPTTTKVVIVRNNKREEYTVRRTEY